MACAGIPLVEPVAVQDEFVTGINHIELIGTSTGRLYWYSDSTPQNGSKQRILTDQMVIPLEYLPTIIRKLERFAEANGIDLRASNPGAEKSPARRVS